MKNYLASIFLLINILCLNVQGANIKPLNIIWSKYLYDTNYKYNYWSNGVSAIENTNEGGVVITGTGFKRSYITKLNKNGKIVWQKTFVYGALVLTKTPDNGYIVGGGETTHNRSFIIKFDKNGNKIWSKYGSMPQSVGIMKVVSALTTTSTGDILIGVYNVSNYSIMKLDKNGNKIWSKNFVGNVVPKKIIITSKGNIIVVSNGYEDDESSSVIKLSNKGKKIWSRVVPNFSAYSCTITSDGGLVLLGDDSNNGYSQILIKLNKNGSEKWTKSYKNYESETGIVRTSDGGFITSGFYIVKLDNKGNRIWVADYGKLLKGDQPYYRVKITKTSDGNFVIGGQDYINDTGVSFILKFKSLSN